MSTVLLCRPEERAQARRLFGRSAIVVIEGGQLTGEPISVLMRTYPPTESPFEFCDVHPRMQPGAVTMTGPLDSLASCARGGR